jgi:hypothetical protein
MGEPAATGQCPSGRLAKSLRQLFDSENAALASPPIDLSAYAGETITVTCGSGCILLTMILPGLRATMARRLTTVTAHSRASVPNGRY